MGTTQECCILFGTNPGSSSLQNSSCMTTCLHKTFKDEQDMLVTTEEVRMKSRITFSYGLLHMDTPVLTDQQNLRLSVQGGNWVQSKGLTESDRG